MSIYITVYNVTLYRCQKHSQLPGQKEETIRPLEGCDLPSPFRGKTITNIYLTFVVFQHRSTQVPSREKRACAKGLRQEHVLCVGGTGVVDVNSREVYETGLHETHQKERDVTHWDQDIHVHASNRCPEPSCYSRLSLLPPKVWAGEVLPDVVEPGKLSP